MNIESVRITSGGYKVNNRFFIPNDSDKPIEKQDFYYKKIVEWVALGNSVEEEETKSQDRVKEEVINVIKSEASRRIQAAYPEWQQVNYMAAVAEIHNKEIGAMKTVPFIAQYTLTADELQTIINANACKAAITAFRVKSNDLERSLDNMTLDELKRFDPTNDSNWV